MAATNLLRLLQCVSAALQRSLERSRVALLVLKALHQLGPRVKPLDFAVDSPMRPALEARVQKHASFTTGVRVEQYLLRHALPFLLHRPQVPRSKGDAREPARVLDPLLEAAALQGALDKAQQMTQIYGRRPYGVALMVAGFDENGTALSIDSSDRSTSLAYLLFASENFIFH